MIDKPLLYFDRSSIFSWSIIVELGNMMSRGVWLFYWMPNCFGNCFEQLWLNSGYHNNRAYFWYYLDFSYDKLVCQVALRKHIVYGQKSAQWMFGEGKETHRYEDVGGKLNFQNVDFIKHAYENQDITGINDMYESDRMANDYEFCFVPNTNEWIPTCRTRGEPCLPSTGQYATEILPYQAHVKEVGTGTYNRYTGVYKQVYVPIPAVGGNTLFIELDARAKSDYSSSTVTNIRVAVYSENWETRIDSVWVLIAGGTTDSGWMLDKNHTFTVEAGAYYNVLIHYNDAWSTEYGQEIFAKNIYIGNVRDKLEDDFEDGKMTFWSNYNSEASNPKFEVHSSAAYFGEYGGRMYMTDSAGNFRVSYQWSKIGDQRIGTEMGTTGKYYSFWTKRSNGYNYAWHDFYPVCQDINSQYLKVRLYNQYLRVYRCYQGTLTTVAEYNIYSQDGEYWAGYWHHVEIHLWAEGIGSDYYLYLQVARRSMRNPTTKYIYSPITLHGPISLNTLYSGPLVVAFRGGWTAGNYGYAYWDNIRIGPSPEGDLF